MELKQSKIDVMAEDIMVLIVPYGIETHVMAGRFHELYRFNRSLWN